MNFEDLNNKSEEKKKTSGFNKTIRSIAAAAVLAGSPTFASESKEYSDRQNRYHLENTESQEEPNKKLIKILESIDEKDLTADEKVELKRLLNNAKQEQDQHEEAMKLRKEKRKEYQYLPEELLDYIDIDPMEILKDEMIGRRDNSAIYKREQSLLSGESWQNVSKQYLKDVENGVEPVPLKTRNRMIDGVSMYDRVLNTQRIIELVKEGKIKPEDGFMINIPRRIYSTEKEAEAAVQRSLRFLGVEQSEFEKLSLPEKEILEQKKIAEIFREAIEPGKINKEKEKTEESEEKIHPKGEDAPVEILKEKTDEEKIKEIKERLWNIG